MNAKHDDVTKIRAKGRLNAKNGSTTLVVTTSTIMNICNVRGSLGMGRYPQTLKLQCANAMTIYIQIKYHRNS